MSSSSYMSTAVMSQPFTVTSHHSNPSASNQSSITTPTGNDIILNNRDSFRNKNYFIILLLPIFGSDNLKAI